MKRSISYHFSSALALILWAAASIPSKASTIAWGSDFSVFPAPSLLTSTGSELDSSYSFEIGAFGLNDPLDPLSGFFVPTLANISQWQANWKVFDRSYDPTPADSGDGDPFGWNPGLFFTGVETLNALGGSESPDATPGAVFSVGEVAYLWAYNSKTIGAGTEWALVMDSNNSPTKWQFAAPTDPDTAWNLSTADTAILGSVNSSSTIALQTAPVLAAVPEASSAFLLLAAAVAGLCRRSRRPTRDSLV